jgi:predicted nucleic acid-binding protein
MPEIIFDTSVYIHALRLGDSAILTLRRATRTGGTKSRPLYLSAVVLEALFVGASSASRGLTIITRNAADYALINEFRPFSFEAI